MMQALCAGFALTEPAQALPGFKKVTLSRFQSTQVQTRSAIGSMIHLHITLSCPLLTITWLQELRSRRKLKIPESDYKEGPQGLK